MLFEWGIAPWEFENAPRHYREEMIAWYRWRNERQRLLREQAELNQKYFGQK